MEYRILDEQRFRTLVSLPDAINCIESVLQAQSQGRLVAPPRHRVTTERGGLAFTCGCIESGAGAALGFRVYDLFPNASTEQDQVTVVYDATDGYLKGIVVSSSLGAVRTAAINGVALKSLAPSQPKRLTLVGTGFQGRYLLQAALVVLEPEEVVLCNRTRSRADTLLSELPKAYDGPCIVVEDVREAVSDADVVLMATSSRQALIEPEWLNQCKHLTTMGPKLAQASEVPASLQDWAEFICTDSLAQVRGYPSPFVFTEALEAGRIAELSDVVADQREAGLSAKRTLFCSVGLAGTEVALADLALIREHGGDGV